MLTGPPLTHPAAASARRPRSFASGPGSSPSAPPRRTVPARSAATLALAVVTATSAAGLFRVFSGYGWVGPVAVAVVAVHLLCWALRRRGVPSAASAPVVALAVVLVASWTVLGRYTFFGIPTVTTWDHAVSALRGLGQQFASLVAPVPPSPGFELIAVGGAAVAAALGDWFAFRWRTSTAALLPGLAAFVFCAASGQGAGRGPVIAAQVAAMGLFLLVERADDGEGRVWFAGIRRGVGPWILATGGVITVAAVVSATALSPALARRDGTGVMGWHSGFGSQGGERIVPNPLADLRTRLIQHANIPVFIVNSPVPSYWRLTSLDTFDGSTWTSTGSYSGFGSRLPGVPPAGASVRTVRATFQIQQLDSVWLPAQFDPIALQGVRHVTYDPGSNSLLTSTATTNGLVYSVTAYQYLDTLSGAELDRAPSLAGNPIAGLNLQLPSSIAAPVLALASTLTAGQPTEYDKALAIQNYLRGPQFTYSLDPPSDGPSSDALYNFLFETRTGYCQQFAGAFAVLARAAGIPTRLAVGFVEGQPVPGGYQVRDADYHTWPEVYFGPGFGWVPFEPTKGFSVPGTSGYADTSGTGTGSTGPSAVTAPTTVPAGQSSTLPPVSKPRITVPAKNVPATGTVGHASGTALWWLALPAVLLGWLVVTAGGTVLAGRLRRRRAARAGPQAVALYAWQQVAAELTWHGMDRRDYETDDEYARRASFFLRRLGLDGPWSHGGLVALAGMARRAAFAPSVPEDLGERATVAAREVTDRLASVTGTRRRVARLWAPPPGVRRLVVRLLRPGGQEPGGGRAGRDRPVRGPR